jgi:hypothetical protein
MKKTILNFCLTLSLFTSINLLNPSKANAGIIVIASTSTAAIIGPVIGLAMTSAGFFWGIQSDDLNYKAAALFILDNKMDSENLEHILSQRYPELDSYLVKELAYSILENANESYFEQDGTKKISIEQDQLASVLELVELTQPTLVAKIKNDLK